MDAHLGTIMKDRYRCGRFSVHRLLPRQRFRHLTSSDWTGNQDDDRTGSSLSLSKDLIGGDSSMSNPTFGHLWPILRSSAVDLWLGNTKSA